MFWESGQKILKIDLTSFSGRVTITTTRNVFNRINNNGGADMKKFNPMEYDERFRYMLLDRLGSDCRYFLGNGNRNEKDLWGLNVPDHIETMKAIWHSFPADKKPEWLTLEQIEEYARQMA